MISFFPSIGIRKRFKK